MGLESSKMRPYAPRLEVARFPWLRLRVQVCAKPPAYALLYTIPIILTCHALSMWPNWHVKVFHIRTRTLRPLGPHGLARDQRLTRRGVPPSNVDRGSRGLTRAGSVVYSHALPCPISDMGDGIIGSLSDGGTRSDPWGERSTPVPSLDHWMYRCPVAGWTLSVNSLSCACSPLSITVQLTSPWELGHHTPLVRSRTGFHHDALSGRRRRGSEGSA
jgi:hypothetical protein